MDPGFPESRTPAASPACAAGRLCCARPASGAVGQFSSVPHPRRSPGSGTRARMFADGTFRAVGTRRLDRGTLGRLLSPALASGQVDRMARSEPGRCPVHPVDTTRFGSRYGTYSRVVDAGTPETKAPGGVPVTGAPPSVRCRCSPGRRDRPPGFVYMAGKDRAGCSAPLFRNQDRGRRDSSRPSGKWKTEAPEGHSGALGRGVSPVQCHTVRMARQELPWRRSFLRGWDVECGMWMEGETPGLPRKVWGLCGFRASRGRRRPPTPPPRLRRASPRSSVCAFRRRRG